MLLPTELRVRFGSLPNPGGRWAESVLFNEQKPRGRLDDPKISCAAF